MTKVFSNRRVDCSNLYAMKRKIKLNAKKAMRSKLNRKLTEAFIR